MVDANKRDGNRVPQIQIETNPDLSEYKEVVSTLKTYCKFV